MTYLVEAGIPGAAVIRVQCSGCRVAMSALGMLPAQCPHCGASLDYLPPVPPTRLFEVPA